jgi:hypothetical protein
VHASRAAGGKAPTPANARNGIQLASERLAAGRGNSGLNPGLSPRAGSGALQPRVGVRVHLPVRPNRATRIDDIAVDVHIDGLLPALV